MAQKALLFNDKVTFEIIMQAKTPDDCKKHGKQVKNFDQATLDAHQEEIMYKGNLGKFRQNPVLKDLLLATGDKHLAEASPCDAKWGIKDEATGRTINSADWLGQKIY